MNIAKPVVGFPYRFLIEPAMKLAHQLDIGNNPSPDALYDASGGCINVWCTPEDNPGGDWNKIEMIKGAYCKPAEFVGTISWEWDDEIKSIIALIIDTDAIDLGRKFPKKYTGRSEPINGKISVKNRIEDLEWVKKKTEILFAQLGLWNLVPVYYENEWRKKS